MEQSPQSIVHLDTFSPTSWAKDYKQEYIWVGVHVNGDFTREIEKDGETEHPFESIDKASLSEFHIVGPLGDDFIDLNTGTFFINGNWVITPLSNLGLNYKDGLIQYKTAHSHKGADTGIHAHNIGFEVTSPELKINLKVIYRIFTETNVRSIFYEQTNLDNQKKIEWSISI